MKTMRETQELFGQVGGKAVEAMVLWAEANQKVLQGLAEFSASAAQEGVRLYSELQAAAVEAVKDGQAYWLRRQDEVGEGKDLVAWFQKSLVDGTEQTQKAFKLLESNAQAVARSAERIQATAEKTAKEVQQTFVSVAEKAKNLYTPSQN